MRLPLPARIGIYLILSGFVLGFVFYLKGWYEDASVEIGLLLIVFSIPGIILLVGTGVFWLIEQWRLLHPRISLTSPGMRSGLLDFGKEPHEFDLQKLQSFSSASRFTVALGICSILLGITSQIGYEHWFDTRTFNPLTMSADLVPGHIQTRNFYINLKDWYAVYFRFDDSLYRTDCRLDAVKTDITLYRDGEKLEEVESSGYLYEFHADKKGNYRLDIAILDTAKCPATLHPQLIVSNGNGDYRDWRFYIRWISFGLILVGIGTLFYSVQVQVGDRISQNRNAIPYETIRRSYYPKVPKPLQKKFSGLPSFGLVGALSISWLITFYMFVAPVPHRGLAVYLVKPPTKNTELQIEPIVVHVADAGIGVLPRVYVNAKVVEWSELKSELKTQLGRRPDWVVYVEGDQNLPFASVATAISDARSLQAKVVLLTPQTEFKPSIRKL